MRQNFAVAAIFEINKNVGSVRQTPSEKQACNEQTRSLKNPDLQPWGGAMRRLSTLKSHVPVPITNSHPPIYPQIVLIKSAT